MKDQLEILKGIHPGLFLSRELRNRQLRSGAFAESIGVHPQTLSAIIKGRRNMNIPLSLKIERSLHLDEGLLMTLQVYYDIELEKKKEAQSYHPDLSIYRKILFWDTDFEKLDWNTNKRYIINRIFERGNEKEILETIRFYGRDTILSLLDLNNKYAVNLKSNIQKYLNYANKTQISNSNAITKKGIDTINV